MWQESVGGNRSDRRCDLPRPLEPPDRLGPSAVGDPSVDQAALDRSMTEVILDEVDRLTGVEKMRFPDHGKLGAKKEELERQQPRARRPRLLPLKFERRADHDRGSVKWKKGDGPGESLLLPCRGRARVIPRRTL